MVKKEIDVKLLKKAMRELIAENKRKVRGRKSNFAHYQYSRGIYDCIKWIDNYLICQRVMEIGCEQDAEKAALIEHLLSKKQEDSQNQTLDIDKIEYI